MNKFYALINSTLPYLRLDVQCPHEEILKEINNVKDRFVKHRDDMSYGWKSLVLHGITATATNDATGNMQWTDVAHQCPITVDFVKSLELTNLRRVRFMLLSPLGFICPHRDKEIPGLNAINVAITQPEKCDFIINGEVIPFEPGSAFLVNTYHRHEVENKGKEDRFHMIIHHSTSTDRYKNLVVESAKKFKAS